MTNEELDQALKAAMGGFTQEQLEQAFQKVRNAEHWKNPIDAEIDEADMDVVSYAVPYFTATSAEFTRLANGRLRVQAGGYWSVPELG